MTALATGPSTGSRSTIASVIQPDVDPIHVLINGIVIIAIVAAAWLLAGFVAHVVWLLVHTGWSLV